MINFVYNSIDTLPLWNFNEVQKSGDLRYLYKLNHYDTFSELSKKEIKEHNKNILIDKKKNGGAICKEVDLNEIFNIIFEEYFEASGGIADDYKKIKMLEVKIQIMKCKRALTRDRSYNTFISIREDDLVRLKKNLITSTYDDQLTSVEMFRKIEIDDKKMTVRKFCTYLKKFNDYNKQQKQIADKRLSDARN